MSAEDLPLKDGPILSFPLSEQQLATLQPGEKIRSVPLDMIVRIISRRIPTETARQANAYGDMGGDFVQHANLQAIHEAAQLYDAEVRVISNSPENQTLVVNIFFPNEPRENFWGKSPRKITFSYNDLMSNWSKIKKLINSKRV